LKLIASIKEPEIKGCFGINNGIYKDYLDPKLFNNCIANWKFSLDDSNWPGASYSGEWKNGKPDGNGVVVYREESEYAGHPADQSARPQILVKDANPLLYDLLEEFEKITGRGAILNTSFIFMVILLLIILSMLMMYLIEVY